MTRLFVPKRPNRCAKSAKAIKDEEDPDEK